MSLPKEFTEDYYDKEYFATKEGKEFTCTNGSKRRWGYKNPDGEFYGSKEILRAWNEMFKPKTMLDVGCGRGTFVAYARDLGIEAYGFDFSKWAVGEGKYFRCQPEWLQCHDASKPWNLYETNSFDLLVALDFYEHIYETDLELVIAEMYRVTKKWIFLQIATVDGVKEKGYILKRGEPIPLDRDARTWAGHVTVETEEWWYERFEYDDWIPRRDMVNWFCALVDKPVIRNWLLNTMIVLERV